jgi:hypothetical protein
MAGACYRPSSHDTAIRLATPQPPVKSKGLDADRISALRDQSAPLIHGDRFLSRVGRVCKGSGANRAGPVCASALPQHAWRPEFPPVSIFDGIIFRSGFAFGASGRSSRSGAVLSLAACSYLLALCDRNEGGICKSESSVSSHEGRLIFPRKNGQS